MMRKIMIVLLAVMVMLSSVSLAEDLSSLADADLLSLYRQISIELESRNIDPKAVYPEDAFSGDDLWTKDMAERLEKFFGFWNASDIPNLLTVCSPGWKAGRDHPDTELLMILGNRTVTDFGINSVSRGPVDYIRIVLLSAGFDTKDGNNPANEIVSISMTREEDGLWYVDPGSMVTFGYTADSTYAEPAPDTAEETPETAMDTVLYYVPEGGEYYHADQNCKRINEKFLPMKGSFTYAELEDEPYKDLMPCEICGAPLRRENPSPSAGVRDAAEEGNQPAGDGSGGKKVYFAAPLFSQSEKDYNLYLTKILEDHGYEVFLPQRDGFLAAELEGKTEEEKTQMIFEKDVSEVLKADIIFMLLDGRVPDEGACVELGIAYANGKRCYGIKSDARSVEINMDLNPMISGCFIKLFANYDGDKLVKELEQYLSENEL